MRRVARSAVIAWGFFGVDAPGGA
jgi:hypothetical protein